jgi:hypothetical protein
MIAIMVQDCLVEDFDHVARHRDKIQEELANIQQLIKQIREGKIASSSRGIDPLAPQSGGRRMRSSPLITAHKHDFLHHT